MKNVRRWQWLGVLALAALALPARGAEVGLTLDEAVRLALAQSKGAQLAQLKVDEAALGVKLAREQRYPRVNVLGLAGRYHEPLDVKVKAGSLTSLLDGVGTDLGLGPLSPTLGQFPSTDLTLLRGERHQYLAGVSFLQPLSQQWRIGSGLVAAQAALEAASRERDRTALQIRMGVEQLYAGILLERSRERAQVARVAFMEAKLTDAENAHTVGELLDDAVLGVRAERTQAQADRLRTEQQRAKLTLQLADLIGRPGVDDLPLAGDLPERPAESLEHWLARAVQNPERVVAAAVVRQAEAGERAARQARIPDVTLFASAYWQEGQALLPARGGVAGVALNWEIFDFGRRNSEARRSVVQRRLAETNRDRLEEEAAREIRSAWQDQIYAGELIALTTQALAYRQRAAELARQAVEQGLELRTKALGAEADLRQAEADALGARLQRHIAVLRLGALTGELR